MDRADSIDRYRSSLRGVATLDADTERELALAWRAGDRLAGEKIVRASLPFVIRIASEYRRWGVPFEDLVQQGNLGLLKAAQKYDPTKNCRLITYAVYWIRAEIRDYVVRSYRIVRLGSTRTERRAMRTYRRSGVQSAAALAETSGMPLARCEMLWPLLSQGDVSLDATIGERGPGVERLGHDGPSPEELAAHNADADGVRSAVRAALAALPEREQKIVRARMLADEPRTLEQLGAEMGVSKERVRQLEERARTRLRAALGDLREAA